MTELDAGLVRRKLALMVRNLDDLGSVESLDLSEYERDRFRRKAVERMLQETVEAAVDVNLHVLRSRGAPVPPDYYESFVQMGREGVLPRELGETLAPAAGLRDRLVHEYDAIDDEIVLRAVADARDGFRRYVAAVERYLSARGR